MKIWRYVGIWIMLMVLGVLVYVVLQTPQLEREWSPDQAVLATAEWNGDKVTIKNVRDFRYTGTTEYEARYYDITLNLADLERVDYIVEPFGSIGAAHTFLSFGFAGGQHIAVSVEIRKEVGETFSPLRGVLRQYELMYVIADERDVIDLRANHRGHDVYLYPTIATPAQGRALLRGMLMRVNALAESPEFYNTVTNNCTINIVDHLNEIVSAQIGWDYRLLLPADSDALAHEYGFIAPGLTLAEARARYQINDKAALHKEAEDFSTRLREPVLSGEVIAPALEVVALDKDVSAVEVNTSDILAETAQVVRIVDGDTIIIDRGRGAERLRYLGIDTPETVHSSEPTGCFGAEASARNQELVAGQTVRLERDISDVDKYGRLLRYVYIGDEMVNLALVQGGYAQVVTYPPDVRHTDTFRAAETAARAAGRGLWGEVCAGVYEPDLVLRSSAGVGQVPPDPSCIIKGNISQTSGERIYHVPGCEYYEQTRINEVTGERWFCTEAEAVVAGWRQALNCPI